MKKIFLILLVILLLPINIFANNEIKLWINGNYVKSDVSPIIENDRTLVPLRVISENLGIKVEWDPDAKTIMTFRNNPHDSDTLLLTIGDNKVAKSTEEATKTGSLWYELETAPKIVNNRTMVPIRFIAEAYKLRVDWDSVNRTVIIGEGYEANAKKPQAKVQSKKVPYFDGTVAEIEDIKIEITSFKVINPGQIGNEYGETPVIAFWYNTTNKTGKEIDSNLAWISIFTAIQDNNPNMINELNVGSLPDLKFLDSQSYTIKKGGTVQNAVAYELSDTKTPVTLKATQGILGKQIGTYSYNIK